MIVNLTHSEHENIIGDSSVECNSSHQNFLSSNSEFAENFLIKQFSGPTISPELSIDSLSDKLSTRLETGNWPDATWVDITVNPSP